MLGDILLGILKSEEAKKLSSSEYTHLINHETTVCVKQVVESELLSVCSEKSFKCMVDNLSMQLLYVVLNEMDAEQRIKGVTQSLISD